MNTPTPITPVPAAPPPAVDPGGMPRRRTRQQFLDAMLAAVDGPAEPLGLHTRQLTDPTVALLDAWATVGDVLSFYQERITAEGYLGTAQQPESVLATAGLTGYRPRRGVAAETVLVYTMSPDPADTPVLLQSGMKAQSVAGPGELPQTFETRADLVARPSWNTLTVRTTALPVLTPATLPTVTDLNLDGVGHRITPNDLLLVDAGPGNDPRLVRVARVSSDVKAGRTEVHLLPDQAAASTAVAADLAQLLAAAPEPGGPQFRALQTDIWSPLQTLADRAARADITVAEFSWALTRIGRALSDWEQLSAARGDTTTAGWARAVSDALTPLAARAARVAGGAAGDGATADTAQAAGEFTALDELMVPLGRTPPPPTAAAAPTPRTAAAVFGGGSDATIRLLTGLRPALLPTLYPALATAGAAATPTAPTASPLRLRTAPFGAQVPPRTVIGTTGQPRTEDWPIGLVRSVAVHLPLSPATVYGSSSARSAAAARAVVTVTTGGLQRTTTAAVPPQEPVVLTSEGSGIPPDTLTATVNGSLYAVSYLHQDPSNPEFAVSFTLDVDATDPRAVVFSFRDDPTAGYTWDSATATPVRASIGQRRLSIAQDFSVAGAGLRRPVSLTVTVETPVPLGRADARELPLDRLYDTILPGGWVVVERGPAPVLPGLEPVVARVLGVRAAVLTRYGQTKKVTSLLLDRPWADPATTLLSQVSPFTVHAQPEPIPLGPAAIGGDIGGHQLELDRLYPGLDAGRPIVVTGSRTDLPGSATVTGTETALIAAVTQGSTSGTADGRPRTTVQLTAPLTYRYDPPSVQVFGNVVRALHGETHQQPFGSGMPGQPDQTFTLAMTPLLDTPTPDGTGAVSCLSVTVDGQPWTEVDRVDADTPPHSYRTGLDSTGHTTITFVGALPPGQGTVQATYRAGQGRAGNVAEHRVTQLLTRPLGVARVDNPQPATGGIDGDGPDTVRANATAGLTSLGRLVTVADYLDLARSWPKVGKAGAAELFDGRQTVLHLTVAAATPVTLTADDPICRGIRHSVTPSVGDPPVVVAPAELALIVLGATVDHDPTVDWTVVEAAVRVALLDAFGYPRRGLGQDVIGSELTAAAHTVTAVTSFTVDALAVVAASTRPSQLANLTEVLAGPPPTSITVPAAGRRTVTADLLPADTLGAFAARNATTVADVALNNPGLDQVVFDGPPPAGRTLTVSAGLQPAQVAYFPADIPDTIVLREATR